MKTTNLSVRSMGHLYDEHDMLVLVGQIAGECYNSDMTEDKCVTRALSCIKRGHHSPWEHVQITLNCTVDRGVSHALVRHRHCAFQQSSTIYQKFDELTVIGKDREVYTQIEQEYKKLLEAGNAPAQARDVLPNALATNLIITTNMRQWQYMFRRRTGPGDSDNMHVWAHIVKQFFMTKYPRITAKFDEYYKEHRI